MEFLQVNLGNLITIVTFLVGGIGFAYTIRSDVKYAIERITNVEEEVKDLSKAMVEIVRQEERMNAMDQRTLAQGIRIDQIVARVDTIVQRELIDGRK